LLKAGIIMTIKILIVDDERLGRETIEAILEGHGYNLEFAENGPQALEKARRLLPDVILLDVMMPGMSGFEVCAQIRQDNLLAEVPIMFLTALDDLQSLISGLKIGADEYITKPYDPDDLRARLITVARMKRHQLTQKQKPWQALF
jgi:DNA-binding response OmpR family regulator